MNNYITVYNARINDLSKPDVVYTSLLRVHCTIKLVEVVTMCILYIYFMTVVVTVCILYIYFVVVLQSHYLT